MIKNRTHRFSLTFSDLDLVPEDILKAMQYDTKTVSGNLYDLTCSLFNQAVKHSSIQAGYHIIKIENIDYSLQRVFINSLELYTAEVVTDQLRGSKYIAVFLATMGRPFDDWSDFYLKNGDPLSAYIINTIGSESLERVANGLEKDLQKQTSPISFNITNRYSPGYCNWSVSEQHKIFTLLPENFCDVTLTESSLMIPLKSISGVIGIGPDVVRSEHPCQLCPRTDCIKRKTAIKE